LLFHFFFINVSWLFVVYLITVCLNNNKKNPKNQFRKNIWTLQTESEPWTPFGCSAPRTMFVWSRSWLTILRGLKRWRWTSMTSSCTRSEAGTPPVERSTATVTGKTFEQISMDFFLDTKHKKKQMWQILQFKRGPIQVTRLDDPNLPNKIVKNVYLIYRRKWKPLNVIAVSVIIWSMCSIYMRSPEPLWPFFSQLTKKPVRLMFSFG
jgi:hypothetical protein